MASVWCAKVASQVLLETFFFPVVLGESPE